ncbi:MAG TPA: hypothetical protein VE593_00625, partial [Nitrososphaeraceae archaeon]|nr:hypothetical protein [Nitrososphaeraceae archaeon]
IVINYIPSRLIKDSPEKTIDKTLISMDAICEALPKLCHECQLVVKESVVKTNSVVEETSPNHKASPLTTTHEHLDQRLNQESTKLSITIKISFAAQIPRF